MFEDSLHYQTELETTLRDNAELFAKLHNKSVLITGATGMIGTALVDLLMKQNQLFNAGITVYAVGRNAEKAKKRFSNLWEKKEFSFIEQDVNLPFHLDIRPDYIIHAASNAYPAAFQKYPVETMLSNFDGTYCLLNLAKETGAHFLFVSSGEIYGEIDAPFKTENDYGYVNSMEARSCYPNSKRAAETLCAAFVHEYGVFANVARLSHVYGPTMTESDNRAVSEFIRNAANGQDIIMKSTGSIVRSYTYVMDACTGLLTILLCGENGEAYNVADENTTVSIRELAEEIAKCGDVQVQMILPEGTKLEGCSNIQRQVMDSEKVRKIGWNVRNTLQDNMSSTVSVIKR